MLCAVRLETLTVRRATGMRDKLTQRDGLRGWTHFDLGAVHLNDGLGSQFW